jgi:DNA-binding NarL/FixJ family response regulator
MQAMQRVLILKADLVCGAALRDMAERVFPKAAVLLVSRIERAQAILEAMPFDLLVTGLDLPDGDALDFIFVAVKTLRRAARVLVVSQHHEQFVLETLARWHVEGVFDPASEGPHDLEKALRTLAAGHSYWSPGLTAQLESKARGGKTLHHILTAAEQAILGGIGDGSDDQTAVERLNRTATNIGDQRRTLHRKLGLHHKGELVQYAALHGFVRFARGRVVRPGFQQLLAAYALSSGRKRGPKTRGDAAAAA